MRKSSIRQKGFIFFVAIFATLNIGFLVMPTDQQFEISKNLDIFGKMYREIHMNYVDEVEPSKFMRNGIDAMLEKLDPYTNYISASQIEDYRFMNTGQYGGIGALIGTRDQKVIINEPYEGYPAVDVGLRAGDEILEIDDVILANQDFATLDVRTLLRGAPGTSVRLKIRRGNEPPFTVSVGRADIKIKNVPYFGMIDDETGYIALTGFTPGAATEVKAAYEALKKDHAGMKSLVLDLRDNPGGLLFESVDISNLFVNQGEKIVSTKGRIEGSVASYAATKPAVDAMIPLAVIVNRRSASASEIVSGVMQDLDRGIVVGQRSYGKGLVQTTRPLSFNTQLKITTAKYYTPSGRCIQAIDYSNRNDDGSVGSVPDSLIKPFLTKNGRTVYDGGGVDPDVKVPAPDYHAVLKELVAQSLIFDFATQYRSTHETIPSAREFKIDDATYAEFTAFVKARKFTYETKSEKELATLKKLMQEESYFKDLEADIQHIESRIVEEKAEDLKKFRKEISAFLVTEIVGRYYYKRGQIEVSFDIDPELTEAVKTLKDTKLYSSILTAK